MLSPDYAALHPGYETYEQRKEEKEAARRKACFTNLRTRVRRAPTLIPPPQAGEGTGGGSSPSGVPLRLFPGTFGPKALLQARLPGTWQDVIRTPAPTGERRPRALHGRYPRPPVPVQGRTSRTGRSAGEHDAQSRPARVANRAGTALAPCSGVPREHDPLSEPDSFSLYLIWGRKSRAT